MGNDYRNGDEMSNAVVTLRAGNKVMGIIPTSIDEAYRLSKAVAASGLAPKGMNTPEQIMVAVMTGAELGLPPMFSINKIAVVNGRPTLWGDAIPALLWGAGFKIRETMSGDNDHRAATCEIVRPSGDVVTRSFGVKDARKAGLWGKQGPWTQYPDRMLAMRARGFCARDAAADVLGGLYLKEEIEEDAPAFDEPARKSAYRARKDGDFEVFKAAVDKCTSEDELTACATAYSGTLATMPRKWEDHCDEYIALKRAKLADATQEPDAPIADVEGYLAKLEDERSLCNSVEDLADLVVANADMISRLEPADRLRATKILTVEE